ncbi:NAD(P)/FAD-dependent oxidoreductase [Paenarthrobacter histidinolovorans]|uniref:NAD(P)/FAD-dependent oxidoreductase n=1 Tax=Paenarthrobacter histidinolovorans TaxID=43664 RepID=UPI0019926E6E|nr:FAD-dependent oxidoreductase [Paenarthrobacter histidinolovorans]GGJ22134.1 pyridine nucleotide-disulfide oxidoreductase [Paenarthrobacter histidinolovorans]
MSRSGGMDAKVVIVGASAGGVSAAEALRARGHTGPIELIGAEKHAPYDRPPLSKQLLKGELLASDVALRASTHLRDLNVAERFGVAATALNTKARTVTLADGTNTDYDRVIIATGVSARQLPIRNSVGGVHTLRTLDEAVALQSAIADAKRVVVVGGGFLGTEIAAAAVALGVDVVLAGKASTLLEGALGATVGEQVAGLHTSRGVELMTGPAATVHQLRVKDGQVTGVEFRSGEFVQADLVILAVGSEPAVDWLRSSSLSLTDGVDCSSDCSAGEGIYAVGDVARWHNPLFNVSMRIEHRTNATDQAIHVAERILNGDTTAYAPVPYFWSDQFDVKIQAHGYLRGHDEVKVIEGSLDDGRMIAIYRTGGTLTGVVAVGAAKALRQWRGHVATKMDWHDAISLS